MTNSVEAMNQRQLKNFFKRIADRLGLPTKTCIIEVESYPAPKRDASTGVGYYDQ